MNAMGTPVVFSLGANLGDPRSTLRAALAELDAHTGISIRSVSPWFRTAPVGLVDQPDFINLVALGTTSLDLEELWDAVSAVENRHGRLRTIPGGPRTLDIDVITVGDRIATTPPLQLPHPRAHQRPFVLVPWLALDPDATLPSRGRVADLLAHLDSSGVQLIADDRAVVQGEQS